MRLFLLSRLLSKREKIMVSLAFLVLLVVLSIKFVNLYRSITIEVPTVGGIYKEGMVGQPQFLNPVLASTENDKTINSLIYQGLVSLDNQNQVTPVLASSYDISQDKKSYTFHLRNDVFWQDGQQFTSADVAYTFSLIQDANNKSPYLDEFKDVLIETPDQNTIILTLKSPYGPFITNLDIGIIQVGKDLVSLNSHPVGTGSYSYLNSTTKGNKIQTLILERNESFWQNKAIIKRLEFHFYDTLEEAKGLFEQEDLSAIPIDSDRVNVNKISYQTAASVNLIFNLRTVPFNDVNLRRAVKSEQKTETEISFSILVMDNLELKKIAEDFQGKMRELGYRVDLDIQKENDFKDKINKKDFQSLIIGIDFGHDFDPYSLWHSSQEVTGLNLAGYLDKNADILLEDARLEIDQNARQAKYDQFKKMIDEQAAQIVLQQKYFTLSVDNKIKNIQIINPLLPSEHLKNITSWYIDTKRVKK